MKRHLSLVMLVILALLLGAASASTQSPAYPTKPIRLILPFAPGGATDFVARIIQPKLGEVLGQQIVIENRPGGSGNLGVEAVKYAAPDGYTILLGNVATMAVNPTLYPAFKLDPVRDFIGITAIADMPGAFAVHPSVPVSTIQEFITYAKARPGQLNYGASVAGSAQGLGFEFFMKKAGIKLQQISYKGGGGAATIAVVSGEVTITATTLISFTPYLASGRLKVIGVVAEKRAPSLPDVPTLVESGFPELKLGSWNGVFAPAGTPVPIVGKLHAAFIKMLNDPQVVERFAANGAVMISSKSPQDFAAFMKSQVDLWGGLVRQLGIKGH